MGNQFRFCRSSVRRWSSALIALIVLVAAPASAQQTGSGVLPGSQPLSSGGAFTSPLLAPDGTASAPPYAFSGETTTGLYRGTNLVALSLQGTARLGVISGDVVIHSGSQLAWSSSAFSGAIDTILLRDAANTPAWRNGTNAQTLRIYNTFTDASNYERVNFSWASNQFNLLVGAAGTGQSRSIAVGTDTTSSGSLTFQTAGTNRWQVSGATGHFLAQSDNTNDIGASGANRPRALYLAGQATIGGDVVASGFLTTSSGVKGPGTVATAGDIRLQNSNSIQFSDSGAAARILIGTGGTSNNETLLGNSAYPTRARTSMATPGSLGNGDVWVESNTGAITGASGALKAQLNGATVFVAPSIRATGRATAQTAANASVATFTVGSADASFEVSANVLVTTATTHTFTVECAYTDEGNTARVLTMPFTLVAGSAIVTSVANANGAVPYIGINMHIRAKASTAITIRTQAAGTYTTVTYNVEGLITQVS